MITFTSTPALFGFSRTRQYGGVTLLFVLIMLLVVSIIGVSAARSTLMQERMSSNTNTRNIVFEAAESALAEGEAKVANTENIWKKIPQGGGCADGICSLSTGENPQWVQASFWINNKTGAVDVKTNMRYTDQEGNKIPIEQKYTIEDLGQTMPTCDPNHIDITRSPDCPYLSSQRFFRVVGFAKAYNTQVMLQSTYLDPRVTRADLEPMSLPPPEKYTCDDGKEYVSGVSMCCWDASAKGTVLHVGQKCPEFCDGKIVGAGQKCCNKGSTKYIHNGTECPKFCGPNQDQYDPKTNRCCPDSSNVRGVIPGAESIECPRYCGGQEYDHTKKDCCKDHITGAWSIEDSCPKWCGPGTTGWVKGKPGDNQCCGTTPYNESPNSGEKCCPDINGKRTLVPVVNGDRSCPVFRWCGSGSNKILMKDGEDCCNGQVYKAGYTSDQACCGGNIYNVNTHFCCHFRNSMAVARRESEECCGSIQSVVKTGECPIVCDNGTIPRQLGESCCGPIPYVQGPTKDCCAHKEFYNPSQQQCCFDASTGLPTVISGNKCPTYCKGELLRDGNECCNHEGQKPIGTCKDFCWHPDNIHGIGAPGKCEIPGGGVGG